MKKFLSLLVLSTVFVFGLSAQKTISGTITDESGEPLIGANVIVEGTANGTITDIDGTYQLDVESDDVTLVVSFTGFASKTASTSGVTTLDFVLSEGELLQDVVIVAYGEEKKGSVASAITSVSAEEIEGRTNASVAQLLQAKAPGLNISTGTGQPGGNSLMLIRGVSSLSGNVEPLFIIDGVPVDEDNFRSLNANDIENISVLKDASASGLYGNRASGGVIVVTTKQGRYNQKLQVRYLGQYGNTATLNPQFTLMSSRQLLELEGDLGVAVGGGRPQSAFVTESLGLNQMGTPLTDAEKDRIGSLYNTNWKDVFIRNGESLSHDLSFRGGGDNINFFVNLGYLDQKAITERSDLERYNFRSNINFRSGRFSTKLSFTANFSNNNSIANEFSGNLDNPFLAPFVSKPYLNPYNDDGSFNIIGDGTAGFFNTPYLTLNENSLSSANAKEVKSLANVRFEYDVLDNLVAHASFGYDFTDVTAQSIQPTNSLRALTGSLSEFEFQGTQNESISKDFRKNIQAGLTYNTSINDQHFFKLSGFTEYIDDDRSGFSFNQSGLFPGLEGTSAGFVDGNTFELDANGDPQYVYVPSLGSFSNSVTQFSYFGILKYDLNSVYGLEISGRRDASSRFSKANRWGTFWSVAARWNITEESFFNAAFVNNLKLRASYGTTGSDRIFGGHYSGLDEIYDLFAPGGGYLGAPGLAPSQIANPNLKWETTKEFNVGLDFAVFDDRINGNIDFYNRTTHDVFAGQPNTLISGGFGSIGANVATMRNRGVELYISTDVLRQNDGLNINLYFNGSINNNEILELPNVEANDDGDIILDRGQRAVEAVGRPFNSYYVVRWAGVNPVNGAPLYLTKDGETTEMFRDEDRVFVGKSSIPKYQGGFGANISYKGFNLNAGFAFVAEVYRNNGTFGVIEDPTLVGIANASVTLANAWTETGQVTTIPALNTGSNRNLLTDRYLEDASFLRLRQVSVDYTFDNLDNVPFSSARIFVQGENVLTWSGWRGFDPEFNNFQVSDFFAFPTFRTFSGGIDITF